MNFMDEKHWLFKSLQKAVFGLCLFLALPTLAGDKIVLSGEVLSIFGRYEREIQATVDKAAKEKHFFLYYFAALELYDNGLSNYAKKYLKKSLESPYPESENISKVYLHLIFLYAEDKEKEEGLHYCEKFDSYLKAHTAFNQGIARSELERFRKDLMNGVASTLPEKDWGL